MKATTFLLGSLLIVPLMGWHALAGKHYTTKKGIQYYIEHLYKVIEYFFVLNKIYGIFNVIHFFQYTWFEAYFECAYRNMSLYTYGSQAEFNDLYELLTSDKLYVYLKSSIRRPSGPPIRRLSGPPIRRLIGLL